MFPHRSDARPANQSRHNPHIGSRSLGSWGYFSVSDGLCCEGKHLGSCLGIVDERPLAELAPADGKARPHDIRAAIEAAITIGYERPLNVLMAVKFLGEDETVLDGKSRALPQMRSRRVHGVAQQHYPALVPVPLNEQSFERTIDDPLVVRDLLCKHADYRPAGSCFVPHRRGRLLARVAWVVRLRGREIQVHEIRANGHEPGTNRTIIDVQSIKTGGAHQVVAPDSLTGEHRQTRLGKYH